MPLLPARRLDFALLPPAVAILRRAHHARQPVTVIQLQMPDNDEGYGTYFAQAVARRSHGTLKIAVDTSNYPSALPANGARAMPSATGTMITPRRVRM